VFQFIIFSPETTNHFGDNPVIELIWPLLSVESKQSQWFFLSHWKTLKMFHLDLWFINLRNSCNCMHKSELSIKNVDDPIGVYSHRRNLEKN